MLLRPTEVRTKKRCSLFGNREAIGDLWQQLFGKAVKPEATLERRVGSVWGKATVDSSFKKGRREVGLAL